MVILFPISYKGERLQIVPARSGDWSSLGICVPGFWGHEPQLDIRFLERGFISPIGVSNLLESEGK